VRVNRSPIALVGIGQTEFSKNSGRSELQLAAEASAAALTDAGMRAADIDGLVTYQIDSTNEPDLMRCLGIPEVRFTSRTRGGGGGCCATLSHAAAAIRSGAATNVLIYRAFNERSGRRFGQPLNERPMRPQGGNIRNWYMPYGLDTPAKTYSLWYQRYMHAYGLTNADFGRYSVVARQYASTNPDAWFFNRPITLDDHQNSRWIVEPILRLLDCCQESDGGVALILTSADRAQDLRQTPVLVEAATESHTMSGDEMHNYYGDDLTDYDEARYIAQQLWDASRLGPDDIDVAMVYENFSPIVFIQLEMFGFCGKGEAKDFIADGQIGPGGKLPVNTNGGLLGEAYIHGMNLITEAARQIRGTAVNQVAGAQHAAVCAGRSALVLGTF
jgi:17-hydroxy-3-oxo-4-pregnene-20-carboxyl-CoA lyase